MLQIVSAPGQPKKIKWEGKYICSSVDPVKEGEQWVEKNKFQLSRQQQVIVLGVGAAYHILALQKKFPNLSIIAIDKNEELIHFSKNEHALELAHVSYIKISSVDELSKNKTIKKAVSSQYAVLKFGPACSANIELYNEIFDQLIGRNKAALQFILSNRAEINQILDHDKMNAGSDELYSIKNLCSAIKNNSSGKHAIMLMLLRELVV